jgi:hypothetical protein
MTPEERAKKLMVRLASTPWLYFEQVIASVFKDAESEIRKEFAENSDQSLRENNELRACLAHGSDPCIYCGLPKAELASCRYGFPGCARADDMTLFEDPWVRE